MIINKGLFVGIDYIIEHSLWILLNILYSLRGIKLLVLFLFSRHQGIYTIKAKNKGKI